MVLPAPCPARASENRRKGKSFVNPSPPLATPGMAGGCDTGPEPPVPASPQACLRQCALPGPAAGPRSQLPGQPWKMTLGLLPSASVPPLDGEPWKMTAWGLVVVAAAAVAATGAAIAAVANTAARIRLNMSSSKC